MSEQARLPDGFGLLVVVVYPTTNIFAIMPQGIILYDNNKLFVFLAGDSQQTDNEHPLLQAVGLSPTEIQHHPMRITP